MPVPTQCQALDDEIEELKQERRDLQAELQSAPTGEKPRLAREIRRLTTLIDAKQTELDGCVAQYGGPPPPQALASSFTGTMSLTTNRSYSGEPFTAPTLWGLLFDGPRTQVFVTAFPSWVINTTAAAPRPIPTPFGPVFGPNMTTITQKGGGSGAYSKTDGNLGLALLLRFDHSREFKPFYDEDSDLPIVLSTTFPSGSPVSAAGRLTLSGSGVFSGGWLNGVTCTMVVTGTLTPVP